VSEPADPSRVHAVPPIAVGWATVELDRAAVVLAPMLAPGTSFEPVTPSEHLGATCRVGRVDPAFVDELAGIVVLLEPSTEGRLAATLARFGEGWCATWDAGRAAGEAGEAATLSARRDGPLGPERLLLGGPVSGPHRLVLDAATIEP
jgi:hypothetical protein